MLCNDIEGSLKTCGDKITLMGGIDNQMIDQKGTCLLYTSPIFADENNVIL